MATFPTSGQLQDQTIIKHTHGNVRKLVKAILKITDFEIGSEAYVRHLQKINIAVIRLDMGYRALRSLSKDKKEGDMSFLDLASAYDKDLHKNNGADTELVRTLLRSVDFSQCNYIETKQIDLLRFAIQDDGFYMPAAHDIISELILDNN